MAYGITPLIPRGRRFSAVSTARDTRRNRSVAIKVLRAQVTADPGPRGTLHDVGHQDGIDFLVMEYPEGQKRGERHSMERRRRASSEPSSTMPPHRSP